ncbi:hypothetical protein [Neobacillus massiliamazoniensis]|uniref:Uncharacterized protein n=1 Tax=Neobacillus massiliamazoniensis TaxID=1499688 RepID=A0A0U1NY66_9BACI|nr:hypothetical protein [Neobacillus massiliamazoniensis]CRK82936.1 hypothetical protein BN000_02891 [Neobacillus massiliamazoniensis]
MDPRKIRPYKKWSTRKIWQTLYYERVKELKIKPPIMAAFVIVLPQFDTIFSRTKIPPKTTLRSHNRLGTFVFVFV